MDQDLIDEAISRGLMTKEEGASYSEAPPPTEAPSPWVGRAQAAGTGLLKGAISGTVGLPGDLEELARFGYGKATGEQPWESKVPFKSEDIYKKIAFALHEPQNASERYIEAGGEGLASMINPFALAGKGKFLGKGAAVLGTAMGLGGEAGREALPTHSIMGQFAGSAIPQTIALLLQGRTPNTVKAAKEYLAAVGEKGLKEAQVRRSAATEGTKFDLFPEGVPTLLNQGTPGVTTLDAIAAEAARSREGAPIAKVVQQQREAEGPLTRGLENRVTRQVTDYAPNARLDLQRDAKMLNRHSPETYRNQAAMYANQWGPDRYALVLKSEFEDAREAAAGKMVAGRPPEHVLTAYVNELAGAPDSLLRAKFKAKFEVLATARGMTAEQAKKAGEGASKFMDALLTLDSGRPPIHTLKDFSEGASRSFIAQAFKASWVAPIRIVGQHIDRIVRAGTMGKFAEAMTSPEGAAMMMDIAKYGVGSNKGLTAMNAIAQQSAMAQSAPLVPQKGNAATPILQQGADYLGGL